MWQSISLHKAKRTIRMGQMTQLIDGQHHASWPCKFQSYTVTYRQFIQSSWEAAHLESLVDVVWWKYVFFFSDKFVLWTHVKDSHYQMQLPKHGFPGMWSLGFGIQYWYFVCRISEIGLRCISLLHLLPVSDRLTCVSWRST